MSEGDLPHPLPDYIVAAARELGRNIPKMRSVDMVMRDAPVEYLLKGVMPLRGVVAIYGPPGSGKSFLATDLAFHSSSGSLSYFGCRLKAVPFIYVGLEGQHGISQRTRAWQMHNGIEIGENVGIFTEPFRLDDPSAIAELADEAVAWFGAGCVVVIDTLAQAMAGFDENNSAEIGAAISGAQGLAAKIRGLIILGGVDKI